MNALRLTIVGLAALLTPSITLAADFPETEPNSEKTQANLVTMGPGDTISGICQGTTTGIGDATVGSADYFDITTAAAPSPGVYEWTLTITTSAGTANTMTLRGNTQNGPGDCVTGATLTIADAAIQTSTGGIVKWYSNQNPSRIIVRVAGSASSASYSALLSRVAAPNLTVVPMGFAAGPITITSRNNGHTTDTELEVWDAAGQIADYHNDDACPSQTTHVLGSTLLRSYSTGKHYVLVANYETVSSILGAADDNFGLGSVADYANTVYNSSTTTALNVAISIDDGSGPVTVPLTKSAAFQVAVVEFTVGAGNLASFCFGDGGDQLGCTNCACGNNAPLGSMGGCLNSNGASTGARLVPSGTPDITNNMDTLHFNVIGANVSTFGILTSGDNRLPNNPANVCFAQNPGSGVQSALLDGLRCVGANVVRHGSRATNANGDIGLTNNGWGPPNNPATGIGVSSGFLAGQTKYFQVFYRENPALVCMTGQATTQGVEVTFL